MKRTVIFAFAMFIVFPCIVSISVSQNSKQDEFPREVREEIPNVERPKTSGFWTPNFIWVDDNWSDTSDNKDWCSGSGTYEDPYVISNCIIDGDNSVTGSCILIQNTNEYFQIINCTLYDSSVIGIRDAGISLDRVENGTITKCNITGNKYGI